MHDIERNGCRMKNTKIKSTFFFRILFIISIGDHFLNFCFFPLSIAAPVEDN